MNGVRLLGAFIVASGAVALGGCVAVPAGPYYDGSVVYSQPAYTYPYSYYPYYPYYGYGWPSVYLSGFYGYYGGRGYYGRPYYGYGRYPHWGHAGYYGGYRGGAGWARRGRV